MSTSLTDREVKLLFDRYYLGLVEFSWRLVGCEETARDIVQDTFVKLLDNRAGVFLDHQKAKSYLYSMVKNASLNHLRREEVIDRYADQHEDSGQSEENILEALIYSESVNQLYAAIANLPEACQQVCTLTYLEEKSNQEAAELTNTSINTVKTHKRRAIEILRKSLLPTIRTLKSFFL